MTYQLARVLPDVGDIGGLYLWVQVGPPRTVTTSDRVYVEGNLFHREQLVDPQTIRGLRSHIDDVDGKSMSVNLEIVELLAVAHDGPPRQRITDWLASDFAKHGPRREED